ncbi:Hypothetical predicted protein [Octopus vulgaris]|uniref:Uncharacterized protein n=1 Tax=Octopus vulgaris TaxID=6645 RepID=A0AA36BJ74_OCTVU|nr:Hypothetical predicted protein [Octopus vulgaris]
MDGKTPSYPNILRFSQFLIGANSLKQFHIFDKMQFIHSFIPYIYFNNGGVSQKKLVFLYHIKTPVNDKSCDDNAME